MIYYTLRAPKGYTSKGGKYRTIAVNVPASELDKVIREQAHRYYPMDLMITVSKMT